MPLNPARPIAADFDRIAQLTRDRWDHSTHYHPFLVEKLPRDCREVLEIGCGTGVFSRRLATRANHVTALDLSSEMIQRAISSSTEFPNIEYHAADATQWPMAREKFDAVASIATLHHLPVEEMVPRMRDALRPGGVLLLLDLFQSRSLFDFAQDALALPFSRIMNRVQNRGIRASPAERAAWAAHAANDHLWTLDDLRAAAARLLPGARVRRHLLFRYSIVWTKPRA